MDKKRCLYCGDIIENLSGFEGFCTTACYQKYKKQHGLDTKALPALPPHFDDKFQKIPVPQTEIEK